MPARRARDRQRRVLAVGLGLTMLVEGPGCAQLKQHQENKIPQLGDIDLEQPRELCKTTLPSYVIEPRDELLVSARPTNLELHDQRIRVQADGLIDLGFDGDVYVAGLTLQQAEWKIAQQLSERAQIRRTKLEDPIEVSVRLAEESATKKYFVFGTVSTQGAFPLRGGETVLEAISEAGLRKNSLPEKACLVRPQPVGHAPLILRIDWVGIKERGDTTTNYQLMPGDRIVVPGGKEPSLLQSLVGGG